MSNLPNWINKTHLNKLFNILLVDGEARLVGGCVRDILLIRQSVDIDIATTLAPEVVQQKLIEAEIKCIPTGIKHGTVTAIIDEKHYEITTLRQDVETFGRHASVKFTNSWEEDAKRRDFTINAMYMDLDGKVYDYFSGQKDLKKKLVKFVGIPEDRIKEDYLRILRYFRFLSYFGTQNIDQKSLSACTKFAEGITSLSGERIRMEMLRIMSSEHLKEAFTLMDDAGILKHISITPLSRKYQAYDFSDDELVNLAAILRCCGEPKDAFHPLKSKWRLSNKESQLLHKLVFEQSLDLNMDDRLHKRQIYIHGANLYLEMLKLAHIETPYISRFKALIKLAETWTPPTFIINGDDLKKMGYNGSEIGKKLNKVHSIWIDSDFEFTKEELLMRV